MTGATLGVGELLFDLLPSGRVPGGAPANYAFHCRQLGRPAGVVSRVGHDEPGNALLRWLESCDIDTTGVQRDPTWPTGAVDVIVNDSGAPSYTIRNDSAWDHITWTDRLAALCGDAAAIATGSLARRAASRGAIESAMRACPGLRYFDVNLRETHHDGDMMRSALTCANVVKLTTEELIRLDLTPRQLTRDHPDLEVVIITRGAAGAEWHTGAGLVAEVPGVAVEVADTVGAGDSFGAVVVVGLLGGHAPAVILREANRYAAEVCRHPGGTPRLDWRCDWA